MQQFIKQILGFDPKTSPEGGLEALNTEKDCEKTVQAQSHQMAVSSGRGSSDSIAIRLPRFRRIRTRGRLGEIRGAECRQSLKTKML